LVEVGFGSVILWFLTLLSIPSLPSTHHRSLVLVCCRPNDGKIVNIGDPIPKAADINIFRMLGGRDRMLPWERAIADKGYCGMEDRDILVTPVKGKIDQLTPDFLTHNICVSSVRILIERVIGIIKRDKSLSDPWRGEILFQPVMFLVSAHFANIQMQYHPIQQNVNPLLTLSK
jgi:hypothetical protein